MTLKLNDHEVEVLNDLNNTPKLYNDHFQNYKRYNIPKAQLVIADIPYNIGTNAYASNPQWYIGGDNKNGRSSKADKAFFDTVLKLKKIFSKVQMK